MILSLLERIDTVASLDDDDASNGDEGNGFDPSGDFEVDPRDLAAMMEVAALPVENLTSVAAVRSPPRSGEAQEAKPSLAAPGQLHPTSGPSYGDVVCNLQRAPLSQLPQPLAPSTLIAAPFVVPTPAVAECDQDDFCIPPPPVGAPLTVLDVTDEHTPDGPARRVRLRLDGSGCGGAEYLLWLQDQWANTPVQAGDTLATACEWSPWGDATLGSRTGGHVVVHPHVLLSTTAVGTSLSCMRKAVLVELLGGGAPTAAAAFGTATHAVFQAALTSSAGDAAHGLTAAAPRVADAMAQQLAAAGQTPASFMRHLDTVGGGIAGWIEAARSGGVAVKDLKTGNHHTLQLDSVEDIEHMVWSPRLGLKGQIDATVRARVDGVPSAAVVPFELKTGHFRAAREHGAQVVLYTALLGDVQGTAVADVPYGLLHYSAPNKRGMGAGETHMVVPSAADRAALMQARNDLAASLVDTRRPQGCLPAVTAAVQDCEQCFKQRECALADAVLQQDAAFTASPTLAKLFSPYTAHLSAASCEFMRHWDAILGHEIAVLQARAASPWLPPRVVRAKGGACLVCLTLVGGAEALTDPQRVMPPGGNLDDPADDSTVDDMLFEYALALPDSDGAAMVAENMHAGDAVHGPDADVRADVALSPFSADDRLLLSIMPSQPDAPPSDVIVVARAVCGGLAQRHGRRMILVRTTRALQLSHHAAAVSQPRWRIDRDDGAGLVTRMRGVLWDCMSDGGSASRVRQLVADLAPPKPRPLLGPIPPDAPGAAAAATLASLLNVEQKCALDAAMACGDYLLLRGLPGTGKTATLCAMAAAFVALGHRVLLCAHTHAAVDAACVRLLSAGVPGVWRAGNHQRVHADVRIACTLPGADEPQPRVVALTASACASPSCPLLQLPPSGRLFDVCLLDEAAQTPLPLALAPLRYSTAFVLAGDTAQLAPLWASSEARAGGGEESLFARLEQAHPSAVVTLAYQYRMNDHIMALANSLVYAGKLQCGSPSTAARRVCPARPLPDNTPAWVAHALRPDAGALFFDTDALGDACAASSRPLRNAGEARLCAHLAAVLSAYMQVQQGDVLLLTPYNAQVDLLRESCAAQGLPDDAFESTTVDRSQGRDVAVVILSCVTTLPMTRVNLLDDARRVCVALTRAQAKLCVVGSRVALCSSPLMARMVEICDTSNWSVTLPADALAALQNRMRKTMND